MQLFSAFITTDWTLDQLKLYLLRLNEWIHTKCTNQSVYKHTQIEEFANKNNLVHKVPMSESGNSQNMSITLDEISENSNAELKRI